MASRPTSSATSMAAVTIFSRDRGPDGPTRGLTGAASFRELIGVRITYATIFAYELRNDLWEGCHGAVDPSFARPTVEVARSCRAHIDRKSTRLNSSHVA